MDNEPIILGVCGGIAAYRVLDVARTLAKIGHPVTTVMTANAEKFVTPLSFAALTAVEVFTETDAFTPRAGIAHTSLTSKAKAFVIAPATADTLAKLAHGIADNMLLTMALAWEGPLIIAPAMNTRMLNNPATKANIATLRSRGHIFIPTDSGVLACYEEGDGKLASVQTIVDYVLDALKPNDLTGLNILISLGGTREPIDPVRFISNRSSGKMGAALANAAYGRGATVKAVVANSDVRLRPGIEVARVETAAQMEGAVTGASRWADIVIMAAAVSDFTPKRVAISKIKKGAAVPTIDLVKTPDILATLGATKRKGQVIVGFAAETDDVEVNALKKIKEKKCDLIVANDVSRKDIGFGSDDNAVTIIGPKGILLKTTRFAKDIIADIVLDTAAPLVKKVRRSS